MLVEVPRDLSPLEQEDAVGGAVAFRFPALCEPRERQSFAAAYRRHGARPVWTFDQRAANRLKVLGRE